MSPGSATKRPWTAMFMPDMEKALDSPPRQPPQDRSAPQPVHPRPGGRPQGQGRRAVTEDDILSRPSRPAPGLSPPRRDLGRPGGPGPQGLYHRSSPHHVRPPPSPSAAWGARASPSSPSPTLISTPGSGYHFGIVDAFISEEKNDNYISFQFKGGPPTSTAGSAGPAWSSSSWMTWASGPD